VSESLPQQDELTAEERAARAEAALQDVLAERNRLWHEVQRREADARDAAELRRRLERLESSAWWRAGAPLRLLSAVLRDPRWALFALASRLKR
jgi:hypothetical protein